MPYIVDASKVMDDSSLKSLLLLNKNQAIILQPPFSKTIKNYKCVLDSSIQSVVIKAICNEADAFNQIQKANSDGSVAIKEGENELVIKVDAADGSHSTYVILAYKPPCTWFFNYSFGC